MIINYTAIQIHHDSEREHWVTSTYSNGEVLLYDSSSTGTIIITITTISASRNIQGCYQG